MAHCSHKPCNSNSLAGLTIDLLRVLVTGVEVSRTLHLAVFRITGDCIIWAGPLTYDEYEDMSSQYVELSALLRQIIWAGWLHAMTMAMAIPCRDRGAFFFVIEALNGMEFYGGWRSTWSLSGRAVQNVTTYIEAMC